MIRIVRVEGAELDGSPLVTTPVTFATKPLVEELRPEKSRSLVLPPIVPYLPCVRLPRLGNGVVEVPSHIVSANIEFTPLGNATSPFVGLFDLYPIERLPWADARRRSRRDHGLPGRPQDPGSEGGAGRAVNDDRVVGPLRPARSARLSPVARDLSILMPVFNERATIEEALADVLSAELPVEQREVILVDDGSTDGTREFLESRTWPDEVRVVLHDGNRGKGAAVRTALDQATNEFTAIFDADLEYRAADLAPLLEPLVSGDASVVFGTRAWTSQSSFSFWYVMGNKGVTFTTNALYNCWISDVMTCFKAMRTDLFRSLPLKERGFAIEPEITARVLRAGQRIHEVPISYKARSREVRQEADGARRATRSADARPLPPCVTPEQRPPDRAEGRRRRASSGRTTPRA